LTGLLSVDRDIVHFPPARADYKED
jgi:hypothetical protein